MNLYKKILGIFNALILLIAIVGLVAYTIEEEDWLGTFLLLIPLYFFSHYLIATKFGFNSESGRSKSILFIIILAIINFIIIGIVPIYTWRQYTLSQNELESSKNWGTTSTVYNIETSLKTKFIDYDIEYVFSAKYDLKKKNPGIKKYIVQFYDKDGFELESLTIDSWTNNMDSTSTRRMGITAHGSEDWKNEDKYLRIDNYSVAVVTQ